MTELDYIVVVGYLVAVTLTGSIFCRGQRSLRDFLLAGRTIPWWAAAFSGIATMVSAISYLGAPGQAFRSDLTFLQYRLVTPLALAIICLVFIPFFRRLDLYTVYEYLERRFDLKTRLVASSLFVLFKCTYLGIVIYAPSLVIAEMTRFPLPAIVLATGAITTAYTMLGGMRAVIWTDSLQLVVLLGGLAVTAWVVVSHVDGGWSAVMASAQHDGKLRFFDLSFDFTTELTLWASLLGGIVLLLNQYGVDQAEMQRFLTTPSVRASQAAIASAMIVSIVIGVGLFLIGASLYVFYQQHPAKGGMLIQPDRVFPKFIVEELPVGLKGLVLAGVFSAGMSTISSVLHSLTTVLMSDFYSRLRHGPSVSLARVTTVGLGGLCTAVALVSDRFGNVLVAATMVTNLFGGPLVGVFLLGMLVRRGTATGALVGLIVGFAAAIATATFTEVSWMWYGSVSAVVTVVTGLLVSPLSTAPSPESVRLVYRPTGVSEEPAA